MVIAAIFAIAIFPDEANRVLACPTICWRRWTKRSASRSRPFLEPCARALQACRAATLNKTPESSRGAAPWEGPVGQPAEGNTADRQYPASPMLAVILSWCGGASLAAPMKGNPDEPGPRQVSWIHRTASGAEIGREEDPKDLYDPRVRPLVYGRCR